MLAVVLTGGCASGLSGNAKNTLTVSLQEDLPAGYPVCCNSFSELPYQDLPLTGSVDITLDASSPVFEFSDGTSFFVAYRLPGEAGDLTVSLRSLVVKEKVFQPRVLLLNAQFQPVRAFGNKAFPYHPAGGFNGDRFAGEFSIELKGSDQVDTRQVNAEKYMIIYSSAEQQAGETTLIHPAKAYAEARGNEPPDIPDPVAVHSAGGLLILSAQWDSDHSGGEIIFRKAGASETGSVSEKTAVSEKTTGSEAIKGNDLTVLPETETYYRSQIEKALKNNDVSKALQLGEEARRVGAHDAYEYLLKRLQVR